VTKQHKMGPIRRFLQCLQYPDVSLCYEGSRSRPASQPFLANASQFMLVKQPKNLQAIASQKTSSVIAQYYETAHLMNETFVAKAYWPTVFLVHVPYWFFD